MKHNLAKKMKRFPTALIVAALVSLGARMSFAQQSVGIVSSTKAESQQSDFYFGVRVGMNDAGESWDPGIRPGIPLGDDGGLMAGIQFDYWFNRTYALEVQLLYNEKGFSMGSSDTSPSLATDFGSVRASYLEIPLLFKVRFGGPDVLPYLYAGPSLGILLSATNGTNGSPTRPGFGSDTTTAVDAKNAFTATDLSALIGGGIEFRCRDYLSFFIDAGYAHGLDNVDAGNSTLFGDNPIYPHSITPRTVKSWEIRLTAGMMVAL